MVIPHKTAYKNDNRGTHITHRGTHVSHKQSFTDIKHCTKNHVQEDQILCDHKSRNVINFGCIKHDLLIVVILVIFSTCSMGLEQRNKINTNSSYKIEEHNTILPPI